MEFAYTAIDPQGAKISEVVKAESEEQAVRRLQSQGCVVIDMKPARASRESGGSSKRTLNFSFSFSKRVKLDQVAALTREFAIMIETGVPVVEAIATIKEHTDKPVIRAALEGAGTDLAEGKTMAQALGGYPNVFPRVFVDMVRTAETGGKLDESLNQAADYLESALEMRRKVMGALTYPMVLLVVALGVVIFLLTYLVPQFSQLFARMQVELPPTTQLLLATSTFLKGHWWLIPITLFGSWFGARTFLGTAFGREVFTRFVHRIPVIGEIVVKVSIARILRSLGTLTGSGVALLIALETAAQTAQNVVLEKAMAEIRDKVEQGISISEAALATGAFPPMVCQMLAVGEKSGKLSNVLERMSSFYERDVDAKLKMIASVIEPVMIVVLGVIVGFIAIAIITPIYSMVGAH